MISIFPLRADALFELIDALLLTLDPRSPVELSASPAFRRRFSMVYDALSHGQVDAELTRQLLATAEPADAIQVEGYPWGAYDQTYVQISTNGGSSWTTLFALDSRNASDSVWHSSGSLSLAAYAGAQNALLRFVFDSVDGYANNYAGWYIDDVSVSYRPRARPAITTLGANGWR